MLALFLGSTLTFAQQNAPATGTKAAKGLNDNPNAKKARAILQQMIDALGGQAYMNIQTIEEEGRTYSYYQGVPNGYGTPFWLFYQVPDKERIELTKQRDVIYIYNGDKGYEITFKGTAAMDPVDLKNYIRRREHSLETVLRASN